MTSTLRDQLLPRSIRPSTLLNTSMAEDGTSRPTFVQSPYSPQPNRNKKHRDIFSLRRCLSRRGSTTTPLAAQDKKKKKKSRKGSLTSATSLTQNTAAAFALLEQAPPVLLCRRSSKQSSSLKKAPPVLRPSLESTLMQWLQRECPKDVVPKVLAFCGPQTTAKLQQSNRFWRDLVSSEATWRVLCEELYKVNPTSTLHFVYLGSEAAMSLVSAFFSLMLCVGLLFYIVRSGVRETKNRSAHGETFIG